MDSCARGPASGLCHLSPAQLGHAAFQALEAPAPCPSPAALRGRNLGVISAAISPATVWPTQLLKILSSPEGHPLKPHFQLLDDRRAF